MRHQVKILNTGESYPCAESQHLLTGMLALGKRGIPSGCHGGGCGVCKVKVVSGDITTQSMSRAHISEQEEMEGVVLACRTFPSSDVKVSVVGKLSKNVLRTSKPKLYGLV